MSAQCVSHRRYSTRKAGNHPGRTQGEDGVHVRGGVRSAFRRRMRLCAWLASASAARDERLSADRRCCFS